MPHITNHIGPLHKMAETLKPREWIADEKGEMCRRIAASRPLYDFIEHITKLDPFSDSISNEFKRAGMIAAVPAYSASRTISPLHWAKRGKREMYRISQWKAGEWSRSRHS